MLFFIKISDHLVPIRSYTYGSRGGVYRCSVFGSLKTHRLPPPREHLRHWLEG